MNPVTRYFRTATNLGITNHEQTKNLIEKIAFLLNQSGKVQGLFKTTEKEVANNVEAMPEFLGILVSSQEQYQKECTEDFSVDEEKINNLFSVEAIDKFNRAFNNFFVQTKSGYEVKNLTEIKKKCPVTSSLIATFITAAINRVKDN